MNNYFFISLFCLMLLFHNSSLFLHSNYLTYSSQIQNAPKKYFYEVKWLSQNVDHFSFRNNATWNQRYLINISNFLPGGPIFFYTGNEGDIELFAQNTGFMWDIANAFAAMVVFAEHRFYGQSWPFGNASVSFQTNEQRGVLTSRQALADFAVLVRYLRAHVSGASNSPVIAFGGSYGGMLSAWFRMTYPDLVLGAIAASAPVHHFRDWVPCDYLVKITTNTFARTGSAACTQNIRASWSAIDEFSKTQPGRDYLRAAFGFCEPLTSPENASRIKELFADIYQNLAMINYPTAADFLKPLPAWPIRQFCSSLNKPLNDSKSLIRGLADGIRFYYNFTGTTPCIKLTGLTVDDDSMDRGWNYQVCTEMLMPMCSNGKTDMFEPAAWDVGNYSNQCYEMFGTRPDEHAVPREYGGPDYARRFASNIVFSNGDMDPWSGGSVLANESSSLVAIIIPNAAHHLDLRPASNDDPTSLKAARALEMQYIRKWLNDWRTCSGSACEPKCELQSDGMDWAYVVAIATSALFLTCTLVLGALLAFICLKQRRAMRGYYYF